MNALCAARSGISASGCAFSSSTVLQRERVAVVGSGNWGSVAAKIAAQNALANDKMFEPTVRMWVHEEWLPISGDEIQMVFNNNLNDDYTGRLNATKVRPTL